MARDKTGSHEKIIKAAKDEFTQYGYEDASMRRIAQEAGLTVSALYKHFDNKEKMFSSLVSPVIDEFMRLYHAFENESFSEISGIIPDHIWENKNETQMIMAFIYEHIDEFDLIINRSKGSKYESFVHDVAVMEEESTLRYMETLKEKGVQIHAVDRREFHLLVTANINAIFEAVRHSFNKEEAMHYAETLERFYEQGWKQLFGY